MPKKPPIPLTAALPAAVLKACKILGVKTDNVIAHRLRDDGDLVIIVNQGQKFTLTDEELDDPKAARARLRAQGVRVIPPLDPTKLAAAAKLDDGLPTDD